MLLNHCRLYAPLSDGFAGEDCCVELDGGKITAVGPARPDTTEAFDCGGQTLLPGLIDLHTHITFLRNVGVAQAHDPMQLVVEAAAQADRYLCHGFTTIRAAVSAAAPTMSGSSLTAGSWQDRIFWPVARR